MKIIQNNKRIGSLLQNAFVASQILQKRTYGTLGNLIFWAIVTLTPILYYLIALLFSGKLMYSLIGVAIIAVCK